MDTVLLPPGPDSKGAGPGTRSVGYDDQAIQGGGGGGFSDMLMGAANAYFTAEGVEEMVDLMDEAGDMLFDDDNQDDF
eukprot:symbB.v1.2.025155.t1/scaffold2425.1/size79515/5